MYTCIFCSTKMMVKISLCLYTIGFSLGFVYYGLTFGTDTFTNDPYLYVLVSGLAEMPGYSLTIPITDYFGRRYPNMVFLFVNGVIIMGIALIPKSEYMILFSLQNTLYIFSLYF